METFYKCDFCEKTSTDSNEIKECEVICLDKAKNQMMKVLDSVKTLKILKEKDLNLLVSWFDEWILSLNKESIAVTLTNCSFDPDALKSILGGPMFFIEKPRKEDKEKEVAEEIDDFKEMVNSIF